MVNNIIILKLLNLNFIKHYYYKELYELNIGSSKIKIFKVILIFKNVLENNFFYMNVTVCTLTTVMFLEVIYKVFFFQNF